MIFPLDDARYAVDMAQNQVSAQFGPKREGPFQIEFLAFPPVGNGRKGKSFGGRLDLEPVSARLVRLPRDRVANAGAGNRRPDVEGLRVIGRPDPRPLAGRDVGYGNDFAHVGHYAGKHVSLHGV